MQTFYSRRASVIHIRYYFFLATLGLKLRTLDHNNTGLAFCSKAQVNLAQPLVVYSTTVVQEQEILFLFIVLLLLFFGLLVKDVEVCYQRACRS